MFNPKIVEEILRIDKVYLDQMRAEGLSEEELTIRHLRMVGVMKLLLTHGMPINSDSIQILEDLTSFLRLYLDFATKVKEK